MHFIFSSSYTYVYSITEGSHSFVKLSECEKSYRDKVNQAKQSIYAKGNDFLDWEKSIRRKIEQVTESEIEMIEELEKRVEEQVWK